MDEWGMEMAEVLERAAERLQKSGWGQHHFESADGSLCVMGAVLKVEKKFALAMGSIDCLNRFLGRPMMSSVPAWNDDPERTQAEVLGVLYGTAKALREGKL